MASGKLPAPPALPLDFKAIPQHFIQGWETLPGFDGGAVVIFKGKSVDMEADCAIAYYTLEEISGDYIWGLKNDVRVTSGLLDHIGIRKTFFKEETTTQFCVVTELWLGGSLNDRIVRQVTLNCDCASYYQR